MSFETLTRVRARREGIAQGLAGLGESGGLCCGLAERALDALERVRSLSRRVQLAVRDSQLDLRALIRVFAGVTRVTKGFAVPQSVPDSDVYRRVPTYSSKGPLGALQNTARSSPLGASRTPVSNPAPPTPHVDSST